MRIVMGAAALAVCLPSVVCPGVCLGVCFGVFIDAGVAAAATSERTRPRASVSLSLDEAVARASESSPLLRLARRERDVVASLRVGAGILLPANPLVTIAAGGRRDHSASVPPANGAEFGARLEQQVELGGQRGTRLSEAARQLDVAGARVRLAEIETRARVRSAYVALQIAEAHQRSAREREALAGRVLDSARARVRAGAASDVELHLAEAEAARFTHERIGAELVIDEAADALRALVGVAAETALTLTTPLQPPATAVDDLGAAWAAAQARRAELAVLDAGRSAINASITRLRRELAPSPALFVEVASQQPGQLYVGGGLALSLPVARRHQGELAYARAEREQLKEEREVTARAIELEVAYLFHAVAAHRSQASLWTDQIVPAATANVELVQKGWIAGKFDIFRVVQVAREAEEARKRELETLGALWDATIALDRATGAR